jgi:hypothetical protein
VRNPDCPRAFGRPDPAQPRHSHPRADQRRTFAQRRACERDTEDSSPASDRTRARECLARSADSSCKTSHLFLAFGTPGWRRSSPRSPPLAWPATSVDTSDRRIAVEATCLDDVYLTRTSDRIRPARYLRSRAPALNRASSPRPARCARLLAGRDARVSMALKGRSDERRRRLPRRKTASIRQAARSPSSRWRRCWAARSMDPTTRLRGHIVHAMRQRQQC